MTFLAAISVLLLAASAAVESLPRPQQPTGAYYPPLAQAPQPSYACCRSNYPSEYGSCRTNADCGLRSQPYCSAFGYCTQIRQYGADGCRPCPPKQ